MKAILVLALVSAIACGRLGFGPRPDGEITGDVAVSDGPPVDVIPIDGLPAVCLTEPDSCATCAIPGTLCDYGALGCCFCNGAQWTCQPDNPPQCPSTPPAEQEGCGPNGLICTYCDVMQYECIGNGFVASLFPLEC